jgi:leader peptidase (prepilin peptidase)/N-methyltransferase
MPFTAAGWAFVLTFTGLLGLVIGSFLNVVIYRVPAGIPLTRESRCPSCDAAVRPWQNVPVLSWLVLRGRCASCRAPISVRYPLVELATALAFVGVVWVTLHRGVDAGGTVIALVLVTIAYLYLAAISVALTLIDLDTRRLPNAIVLPSYVVLGVLFIAASALGAGWDSLLRATIGALTLYLFYFILRVVRPGGMGGGDVKLAGVLGAALGWIGWGALVVGAFAAFVLGGLFGLAMLALRRANRKSSIPFGPWMLAGAWTGIIAGEQIAGAYLGLLPTV